MHSRNVTSRQHDLNVPSTRRGSSLQNAFAHYFASIDIGDMLPAQRQTGSISSPTKDCWKSQSVEEGGMNEEETLQRFKGEEKAVGEAARR